ncbi:MAG: glycoside hydrolase family 38 C-terminal domain-containing protein, partial [Clostridia bacterium]
GVGDGGGGPSEAHIEMISRQKTLQGCPVVETGRAVDFFDRINEKKQNLPTYCGELYLEKHQGTYTTQGRNKRFNRLAEYALQDIEALAALGYTKGYEYPQEDIDRWWKEVLLYQFHDIIPGSSIQRVYVESRARYEIILKEIEQKRMEILEFLCGIGDEKIVFNSTSFDREEVINNKNFDKVNVGAYSFAKLETNEKDCNLQEIEGGITNGVLKVKFGANGEISSLKDSNDLEFSKEYLNRLKLFFDRPLHYNAWDIDWKYHNHSGKTLKAYKFETVIENGKITRRNFFKHGKTKIIQEVSLYSRADRVTIKTSCDFDEIYKMLRAEFMPVPVSD